MGSRSPTSHSRSCLVIAVVALMGSALVVAKSTPGVELASNAVLALSLIGVIGVAAVARLAYALTCDHRDLARTAEALHRHSAVLERTSDIVAFFDPQGKLLQLNQAGRSLIGDKKSSDMKELELASLFPESSVTQILTQAVPRALSGDAWEGEMLVKTPEGETPMSAVWLGHHHPGGSLAFYSCLMRDISAQKKVECQLRDMATQLKLSQLALDKASERILWADSTGRIFYANEAASQSLGYSRDALVQMTIGDIDPKFASSKWVVHWQELLAKRTMLLESEHVRKDGTRLPIECLVSVMKGPSGCEFACGFIRDISARKQIEIELRRAKESAEAASRAKNLFLAHMSHEVRTPLAAILGFSEMLMANELTEADRKKGIEKILSNGRHLLALIDDILDLSKVEAGQLEMRLSRVILSQEIQRACASIETRALAKGLRFEVSYSGDLPENVVTDPTRLRQILINLLNNAVKFTDRGGVWLTVRALPHASVGPVMVEMAVSDTGAGIAPESQSLLFRPFLQLHAAQAHPHEGTGLGLALARRLAQSLGGDVSLARSEPGKGSTFHFTFSAGSAEELNMVRVKRPSLLSPPAGHSATPSIGRLDGISVLLVEDSEDNQVILTYFLERAGAKVTIARDGLSGVREALTNRHSVILMDIQMPQMDGYAATVLLRSRNCQTPIVALTAHAMRGEQEHCLQAGCNDYLAKPVDPQTLVDTVARHSEGWFIASCELRCPSA